MQHNNKLGRLERADVRQAWAHEAHGFTPWLAQEEHLNILAKALHLNLTLEASEQSVGTFRADILAKDTDTNQWVLIENQLDRTDHCHLGQLITYASGIRANCIIWIAESFTNEHRAALDWLNENTANSLRFFGVQLEVWRIGDSPLAPRFNVIALPNDWTRTVTNTITQKRPATRQAEVCAYILSFISREDREPSISEIMNNAGCAKQTAINSRNAAREILQQREQDSNRDQAANS